MFYEKPLISQRLHVNQILLLPYSLKMPLRKSDGHSQPLVAAFFACLFQVRNQVAND